MRMADCGLCCEYWATAGLPAVVSPIERDMELDRTYDQPVTDACVTGHRDCEVSAELFDIVR